MRSGDKCLSKKKEKRKQIPKRNTASANNNLSLSNRRGIEGEREHVIEKRETGR